MAGGVRRPTRPSSSATATRSSGRRSAYGTPLGLITHHAGGAVDPARVAERQRHEAGPRRAPGSPARPPRAASAATASSRLTARARGGGTPGSSGSRSGMRGRSIVSSMSRSSIPAISAKSISGSGPIARLSTVWWAPPAVSHASTAVRMSGRGRQTARATGSRGSSSVASTTSIDVGDDPEAIAKVREPGDDRRARGGVEHEPHRIRPSADRRAGGSRSAAGRRRSIGQTSSMCAPSTVRAGRIEVVRVVLHERRPARQPGRHHLEQPDQHRALPVPLGAEPVAVGHQALDRDPRQLAQPVEVLERVGEGPEPARGQERPQPGLDPRGLAQLVAPLAVAGRARAPRSYSSVVGLDEAVDVGRPDAARPPRPSRSSRSR